MKKIAFLACLLAVGTAQAQIVESSNGNYALIPATGTNTIDLSAKTAGYSFKIYDDGGPAANYADNASGSMLITVPEGCQVKVKGVVYTEYNNDYLCIYDGENTSEAVLSKVSGGYDDTNLSYSVEAIGSGQNMLLRFVSDGSSNATGLNITATIVNYVKDGSFLHSDDSKTEIVKYVGGTTTIPATVKSIAACAFKGSNLTTLSIPATVESIGTEAFASVVNINYSGAATGSPWGAQCTDAIVLNNFVFADYGRTIVKYIGGNATTVTIPEGVTAIGKDAFYDCGTIETLNVPATVSKIGESAFSSSITNVNYASIGSLCSIEADYNYYLHGNSHKLLIGGAEVTAVEIPDGIMRIGAYAFYYCNKITSVSIPASVKSIGQNAFSGCNALTKTTFESLAHLLSIDFESSSSNPKSQNYSSNKLFFGATQAGNTLTIPEGTVSIGNSAFCGCTNYTSVSIPASVKSIGQGAFANCTKLTKTTFASIESLCSIDFKSSNSNPLSNNTSNNKLYIGSTQATEIAIPNGVTNIGNYTFFNAKLSSVSIPASVKSIGQYAFYNNNFSTLTIPEGVTLIDNNAFYNTKLTSVTIPSTVEIIGSCAFYNTKLTSVDVPATVKSIGDVAFYNALNVNYTGAATGSPWGAHTFNGTVDGDFVYADAAKTIISGYFGTATAVTIPNGVKKIGDRVFYQKGLTALTLPATLDSIGNYAFYDNDGLTTLTIPESVKYIGDHAFYDCDKLTSVTISAETIGSYAFYSCNELASVVTTNSVKKIDDYAFYYCQKLSSFTFGNSVQSIGSSAFFSCPLLKNVSLPNSIENVANNSFGSATYTTEGNASYLGNTENPYLVLVKSNSGITSCTINNQCKVIASSAFSGKSTLTSVSISASVKHINRYAFDNCKNLSTVDIPSTVETIGSSAFRNVPAINYTGAATSSPWGAFIINGGGSGSDFVFSDAEQTYLTKYTGTADTVVVPNGVETIGECAFVDCKAVAIVLPATVKNIMCDAFYGCVNLCSINIPHSVEFIGDYAFQDCHTLTDVVIPASVTEMGEYVFNNSSEVSTEWAQEPAGWSEGWRYNCDGDLIDVMWGTVQPELAEGFVAFNKWFSDGKKASNRILNATAPDGSQAIKVNVGYGAADGENWTSSDYSQLCNIFHAMNGQAVGNSFKLSFDVYFDSKNGDDEDAYLYVGTGKVPANFNIHPAYDNSNNPNTELLDTRGNRLDYQGEQLQPGKWHSVTYEGIIGKAGADYIGIEIDLGGGWYNRGDVYLRNLTVEMNGQAVGSPVAVVATANNAAYGTVKGSGVYAEGQMVTLKATPKTGYKFVRWSDGVTTAERNVMATVSEQAEYSAIFAPLTFTVTLTAGEHGSVIGGGEYDFGSLAFIRAKADEGYIFDKWNDNSSDNIYSGRPFIVTGNITLAASFAARDTVKIIVEKIVEVPVTSARQAEAVNMSIFPNPTSAFVTATADSEFSYTLTNAAGKVLRKDENASSYVIDLSDFADGIYMLSTSDGSMHKIVKQ